jgi:hypothetical protein
MDKVRKILLFSALSLFCSAGLTLAATNSGLCRVKVEDENGAPVANAQVFVSLEAGGSRPIVKNCPDNIDFTLAPGNYHIYATAVRNGRDLIDHLVSPEAQVQVTSEPMHLVLRLHAQDDPLSQISPADLSRMGLDPHLIKDLN